jgi:hypothetical protein
MALDPIGTLREWKHKVASLQQRWRKARQGTVTGRNRAVAVARKQWEQREATGARTGTAASRERKAEATTGRSSSGQQATSGTVFAGHTQTESANLGAQVRCRLASGTAKPSPPSRRSHRGTTSTQSECGGALEVERIASQYQQEIVRTPFWRRFDIPICRCQKCHKRVQGRDGRQTSDALGAAAVQLGPNALSLAVKMNKGLGMPHADVAAVLQDGFQLPVNRSAL